MSASSKHRWPALAEHLPCTPAAYHAAVVTLLARMEYAAADQGVAAGLELFPHDGALAVQAALAAERKREWRAAVRAWQHAHACLPDDRSVAASLAAVYLRTGKINEAESLLAITLYPPDSPAPDPGDELTIRLMIDHARAAGLRGDYVGARSRWQALARLVPENKHVQRGLKEIGALNLPEIRETAPWKPKPHEVVETPYAELMMRFEGLGGTCEFGLAQRHYGAEPLGLFRWVGVNMANLCSALSNELAGIGEPRYTRMDVTSVGEFVTTDTRYGLGMHTFMRDSGQDREKLLAQLRRRMCFLRDKLLQDLRAGEKIFVYRHLHYPPDKQSMQLLAAVRAYNPRNRLVVIKMLPHGTPGETLKPFADGALCGAIGNGRKPEQGTGWGIDFDFWLQTCQAAVQMLDRPENEFPPEAG
jgi:tetratricopeptide (TPR) repeat protein